MLRRGPSLNLRAPRGLTFPPNGCRSFDFLPAHGFVQTLGSHFSAIMETIIWAEATTNKLNPMETTIFGMNTGIHG